MARSQANTYLPRPLEQHTANASGSSAPTWPSEGTVSQHAQSWVEINTVNIVENARTLIKNAPGTGLLAVLKANAYGLGAVEIARVLGSLPLWGVAVTNLEEATILRESGILDRILVLRPPTVTMCSDYRHYSLRPVVENEAFLRHWSGPFHVEIDTGMSRTGVPWSLNSELKRLSAYRPEGVFTHLHSVEHSQDSVKLQLTRFEQAQTVVRHNTSLRHVANSAGVFALKDHYELIRPGLFLFGGRPSLLAPQPAPVVSVRSTVVSIRLLRRGETVSYGGEWRAEQDIELATLSIGYADGIPRSLDKNSYVLIRGKRCPIVGRITMDMLMVDVSSLPQPRVGDTATLIGRDGPATISLDLFAHWSGLIPYEVLAGLGSRLPRIYSTDATEYYAS